MSHTTRDLIGGAAFIALGVAGLLGLGDLPFGSSHLPGPAMLPSVLSTLIIVLAAAHMVRAVRTGTRRSSGDAVTGAMPALTATAPTAPAPTVAELTAPAPTAAEPTVAELTAAEPTAAGAAPHAALLRVAGAVAIIAAWVPAARALGYLGATALAMSALYALGGGRPAHALLAGVALTLITWLLFGVLLGVPLPSASLFD
ncbi:MAG: tripartite tricarboxylate transporter TctB family protein [Burkholderiaceae bacterium]